MRSLASFTLLAFGLALIAGCSQDADAPPPASDYPIETHDDLAADTPDSVASVSFTASNTTALEPGGPVTLTITVENFTLDSEGFGGENEPGSGHYRVYWDDGEGDDYLAAGTDEEISLSVPTDTTDGSHRLRVMLVNNDGTPLDPPVEEGIWVIVYRI